MLLTKRRCFIRHFRENWQNFCHAWQILAIKGKGVWVGWVWVSSLKKENLQRKPFSNNAEWSSKRLYKMISANIKTDVNQEIKEIIAVSFHRITFSKLEIQCKTGLILVGILTSLSVKNKDGGGEGWGGFQETAKICSAWQKLFVEDLLVAGCFYLNLKFILKSSSTLQRCKNQVTICLGAG